MCLSQHLPALLSSCSQEFRVPSLFQLPPAIKLSLLPVLWGLFPFKLTEMEPWISKVIPGGSQVTPRDGREVEQDEF